MLFFASVYCISEANAAYAFVCLSVLNATIMVEDYNRDLPLLAMIFYEFHASAGLDLSLKKTVFIPLWFFSRASTVQCVLKDMCPCWAELSVAGSLCTTPSTSISVTGNNACRFIDFFFRAFKSWAVAITSLLLAQATRALKRRLDKTMRVISSAHCRICHRSILIRKGSHSRRRCRALRCERWSWIFFAKYVSKWSADSN